MLQQSIYMHVSPQTKHKYMRSLTLHAHIIVFYEQIKRSILFMNLVVELTVYFWYRTGRKMMHARDTVGGKSTGKLFSQFLIQKNIRLFAYIYIFFRIVVTGKN